MIKKIITFIIVIQAVTAFSQKRIKIELNSGLYSKFLYDSNDVSTENNLHGTSLGVSYAINLKPKWGVETGLLFSTYSTTISLRKNIVETFEIDDTGSGFAMQLLPKGYKERISMNAIEIPVRLFFDSFSDNKKIGYYASLGGKFIQPLSQKGNIKTDNLTVKGFYPDTNVTIDDLPNHGFGSWDNFEGDTEPNLTSTITISAEIGINFNIDKDRFYLGLFGDYGLSNLNRNQTTKSSLIEYNSKGKPNKVIGSHALKGVNSIKLVTLGLQLKYCFL